MNFVQNILWNSVSGFVEAGTRTAGGYAGDALIKAGDMIENSGRGVGNRLERTASGYGTRISGQGYQSTNPGKALPSTARRPVAKRSNSIPASMKAVGPTSKTPVGAKKNPGGNATKQITSGVSGAQKILGGVGGGAQKAIGGVPGNTQKTLGGVTGGAQKSLNNAKGIPESKTNNLPKPYPNTNTSTYPNNEKKTAVKPGQHKPFNAAQAKPDVGGDKKPYPGTNTLPGQGKKTPVRPQKYKPAPRLQGTAEKGKVQHIAV